MASFFPHYRPVLQSYFRPMVCNYSPSRMGDISEIYAPHGGDYWGLVGGQLTLATWGKTWKQAWLTLPVEDCFLEWLSAFYVTTQAFFDIFYVLVYFRPFALSVSCNRYGPRRMMVTSNFSFDTSIPINEFFIDLHFVFCTLQYKGATN